MYYIYGIKNCDTMKKALDWLNNQQIPYVFHNYKTDGITHEQITHWFKLIDWTVLVNTRGLTYRRLDAEIKAQLTNPKDAADIMVSNPSIIKRPILIKGNYIKVGFDAEEYLAFIAETADGK